MNTSIINNFFLNILLNPTRQLKDIEENPKVFFPFLLITITGIVTAFVLHRYSFSIISDFFEIESTTSMNVILFFIYAIIICSFLTIEWMIFSVLIFFFTIIYSFKVVNIKYIFSIVGLSWVPIIIKTFSYLILIIINDEIFAPQGLTIFFNDLPEIAKVTLQNLDIFVLWQLLIIYFGVNIITKKKLLSSLIVLTTFSITILIKIFPYILATTIMN